MYSVEPIDYSFISYFKTPMSIGQTSEHHPGHLQVWSCTGTRFQVDFTFSLFDYTLPRVDKASPDDIKNVIVNTFF